MRATCLLVAIVVAVILAGRGLGDEGSVTLHADTPRYLMNGAFLTDFLRDHPIQAPLKYVQQYFARYPALSLGHHPLPTAMMEVPFFAVFGLSVWAGRLSVLFTVVVTICAWFRFVEQSYDTSTAFLASLFLASTPMSVRLAQEAGAEPLTICLIVLALFFLQRYCATERLRDGIAFIAAAVGSVYAKQFAVLVFPVYALMFVQTFGVRRLLQPRSIVAMAIIGVCTLPAVALTMKYSQFNLQIVTEFIPTERRISRFRTFFNPLRAMTLFQVRVPVLVAAAVSVAAAAWRLDRRALPFVVWLGGVYLGLLLLGVNNGRFAYYGSPALCALAAGAMAAARTVRQRQLVIAVLLLAAIHQVALSAPVRPRGAGGYESAARFVTDQRAGDSVLYSAVHDTGLFVFFVRKHDPRREMIVIRADKVLTTSREAEMDFERLVHRPDEIFPILNEYGVGYVVLEDVRYPDGPLEWLRQLMLQDDRFALRQRIPIATSDVNLAGTRLSLAVYEYKDRHPADHTARLSMKIPLMNDSVGVTFGDLLGAKAR